VYLVIIYIFRIAPVLVRVVQRNTHTYELAGTIMEANKSHDLPSAAGEGGKQVV
jgi:hypothetical protein